MPIFDITEMMLEKFEDSVGNKKDILDTKNVYIS